MQSLLADQVTHWAAGKWSRPFARSLVFALMWGVFSTAIPSAVAQSVDLGAEQPTPSDELALDQRQSRRSIPARREAHSPHGRV